MLRKAARKVSSYYDKALMPLGINVGQFSLLRNIDRMAPISLTELGLQVELDRSTVGRNAKVLERMGLVAATPGKDQREAVLTMTEQGKSILDLGLPLWNIAQQDIEKKLGAGNTPLLQNLLAAL